MAASLQLVPFLYTPLGQLSLILTLEHISCSGSTHLVDSPLTMPHSPTATVPKRKNPADPSDADHAAKKARKEAKKDKKEKKNKSKSKHKSKTDVDLLSSAESEFRSVKASVQLTIPPVFASKPHEGANELLDSMIMRCVCYTVPRAEIRL